MFRIFITRKILEAGIKLFQDAGYEVIVGPEEIISRQELLNKVKGIEALVPILTEKIDAEVMEAAGPQLKIIACYSIGYDHIAVEEAKKRGIYVTNTPGANITNVAEHTIALMLDLAHRITESDRFTRKGLFKGWDPKPFFLGQDLNGKTLGLIGLGQIGQKVAFMAKKAFLMEVFYYDLKRNERLEKELNLVFCSSLEALLPKVDFLSIHLPLNSNTFHLLNKERLGLLKSGAFLINTSRGAIIDEQALVEALQMGKIRGAGLDVYEKEPALTAGLTDLENVVLTPHTAAASFESRLTMAKIVRENIEAVFRGEIPPNLVY